MNINCTGCGGIHPLPGGSLCKNLLFSQYPGRKEDNTQGAMATDTNSKMATATGINWAAILSSDELSTIPDRSSDDYMAFCEKMISELTQKVEASREESKILSAEQKICELMSQLHVSESSRERKLSHRDSLGGVVLPDTSPEQPSQLFSGQFRNVVEPSDSKEYLCKLITCRSSFNTS